MQQDSTGSDQAPDPAPSPDSPLNIPPLPFEEAPPGRPDLAEPKPELEPDPEPETPLNTPVAEPPPLPGH